MKTLELGTTGERVSALCLGCMIFGSRVDEPASFAMLDRYLEAGGSFLDTANNYAFWLDGFEGGESERLLGRWMRERGNRDDLFLASKVGGNPTHAGGGLEAAEGLSAAAIERAVESSLTRLGTDRLDLYYAHVEDRDTPLEETLAAFDRLVSDGRVRYVAASNHPAWRMAEARALADRHGWAPWVGAQQRYSYLRPRPGSDFGRQLPAGDEMLDYARTHPEVTLLAYSPLLGGCYTRDDRPVPEPYRGPDSDARMRELHALAGELGVTANQLVLAWMLHHEPPVLPLLGPSRMEQLEELLPAADLALTPAQVERLDRAGA